MAFVDMGNCVEFKVKHDVTTKDHFTTRAGRRTKDRTDVTQVGATATFSLDEINGPNMAVLAMATVISNTDGSITLNGLSKTVFTGTLRVTGLNERGPVLTWVGKVSFTPGGDITLIANNDDYVVIPITANVQPDGSGHYGVWTIDGAAAAPNLENYVIPTGKVEFQAD